MLLVDTLSFADMRRRLDPAAEPSRSFPPQRARIARVIRVAQSRSCRRAEIPRHDHERCRIAGRRAGPRGSSVGADRRRRQELRGRHAAQFIASMLLTASRNIHGRADRAVQVVSTWTSSTYSASARRKSFRASARTCFPAVCPGVTQGIPPEYMKGNQPPPETAQPAPHAAQAKAAPQATKKTPRSRARGRSQSRSRNQRSRSPSRKPNRAQDTAAAVGWPHAAGAAPHSRRQQGSQPGWPGPAQTSSRGSRGLPRRQPGTFQR